MCSVPSPVPRASLSSVHLDLTRWSLHREALITLPRLLAKCLAVGTGYEFVEEMCIPLQKVLRRMDFLSANCLQHFPWLLS